jgi:hypothetical protein
LRRPCGICLEGEVRDGEGQHRQHAGTRAERITARPPLQQKQRRQANRLQAIQSQRQTYHPDNAEQADKENFSSVRLT